MKNLFFTVSIILSSYSVFSQTANSPTNELAQKKQKENQISGAKVGQMACRDESGKLTLCSGAEFENIQGIITNEPFITINKPASPNANRRVFQAYVSLANGTIEKGTNLCTGKGGTLQTCTKGWLPFAIAAENATTEGSLIKVQVIDLR